MKKTTFPNATNSDRVGVLSYAAQRYGTTADYPWQALPGYAVLRHRDSGKWYGLIMDVPRDKLGLPGPGRVDVLEVKADPASGGSVMGQPGILPAYHMARGSWISVLLDGTVPPALLFALLDGSYTATASTRRRAPPPGTGKSGSCPPIPVTLIWKLRSPRTPQCGGSSGSKPLWGTSSICM